MPVLSYDPAVCEACETLDCLMRCQYIDLDLAAARAEKDRLLRGEKTRLLTDCATCYACEEYCPQGNHPFYQIVERQEELGVQPVPAPITHQQLRAMDMRGDLAPRKVQSPVINLCFFGALAPTLRGPLYEGASIISGSDIFCNIMWLHFGRTSTIKERLARAIENLSSGFLKESGVEELIHYHDECYGAYTHLAPAFGLEVPFRSVHLFEYLARRLDALKDRIRPLKAVVAYQRPCSNRLVPETQVWVDEIFRRIGVERVERKYDRENALCCGGTLRAQQRFELADEVQQNNIDDMAAAGAKYCVFNCPACLFTLRDAVSERGIQPILMSDLCQMALGQ